MDNFHALFADGWKGKPFPGVFTEAWCSGLGDLPPTSQCGNCSPGPVEQQPRGQTDFIPGAGSRRSWGRRQIFLRPGRPCCYREIFLVTFLFFLCL